jgi:uncharacterized protein
MKIPTRIAAGAIWAFLLAVGLVSADTTDAPDASKIDFHWGIKIPMRDGVHLNATVYTPRDQKGPVPCVFTLTPYIGQNYHERGVYFAAHGIPFLTVDVRGRGNSEGQFRPFIQEAHDGYDVVEWLAAQPYCNGKVAMWGGSYAGYDQWATAKEIPPHLATIVPVASAYAGVDFPMRNNVSFPYLVQWLTYVSGHTSQENIFGDDHLWPSLYRRVIETGQPFSSVDTLAGNPLPAFHEWISHPYRDEFWAAYNPTHEQYARMQFPILTITGSNDDDQPGALTFYREHMQYASAEARSRHFLVIGPWNHAGTRTPKAEFDGMKFGPASLVDLPKLHVEWYAWAMQGGPRPAFLEKPVAYYVMGAERWRYADSLDAVTGKAEPYYLDSANNATDVLSSGTLAPGKTARGAPDHYVYDPRDTHNAQLESTLDPGNHAEQRMVFAQSGQELIYHSAAFDKPTEVSGFFKLCAWISIDQPDTDFRAAVYEIGRDGSSVLLTDDVLRARYRENLHAPKLIGGKEALRYDFEHFTFVARQIQPGSRLRLVISPINSIFSQKNYNSGREISAETFNDARPVTVTLYHDRSHPTALIVPVGRE